MSMSILTKSTNVCGCGCILCPSLARSVSLVSTCRRPKLFVQFFLILFLPFSSPPPTFPSPKFFTSSLYHPSITFSCFRVPLCTPPQIFSLAPNLAPLLSFSYILILLLQFSFIIHPFPPVYPLLFMFSSHPLSDGPGKTY